MSEWLDLDWTFDHGSEIAGLLREHVWLTFLAVAIGTAISVPLAVMAFRHRRAYGPITGTAGVIYTIPSLALFALITPYTGLTTLTAEIGLVGYTLLIIIRNTVAGLQAVPEDAEEAARGMGYTDRQLLWRVQMPLAVPVIVAGIRIATVTTIGLVTVTAIIGKGGLGRYILMGLRRFFPTPIVIAVVLSVALAVTAEILLTLAERRLTPWARARAREAA